MRLWDPDTGQPLGEPLEGHSDWVAGVAFSPDGQRLATVSADETARLWQTDTLEPLGEPLKGLTGWKYAVAFSPDGRRLATAGDDGVRLRPADASPEVLCDKLTANMSPQQWSDWDIDYVTLCPGLPTPAEG